VQRTIRILRVALPILFFGFVLLIAFSWNRARTQKEKGTAEPVTSTIRPVDKPQLESKSFEDTQTIAGRLAARIRARRVVAFQSGWNTLENVELTIFRPNGLTYDLVCPQAQFNSETKEADAKGGVKLTSTDGVEITTAEIHFDGNRLTNHIPVQFRVDRWIGKAGALDLDVQAERLRLYENLDATLQPETTAEAPMNLQSSDGIFRRAENSVDFNTNVVMTRADDRLTGDQMTARFTPDRKSLTGMEGRGHVDIVMAAAGSPGSGRKEITCEHFWSEMANGIMSAINAGGDQGPVHAVMDGPPKRDLDAKNIRVGLANRQVTDFRADDSVVLNEFEPVARQMTADHLTVYFDARTHQAASAVADGNFHYRDPDNDARAVRANYDIAGDSLVLTASPGFQPSVTAGGETLKAKTIAFAPRAGTAKATGDVIAQLTAKDSGPSAASTGLFPGGKPVFVNSDSVSMRQSAKTAVFTGHVRAWQDTNTLFAEELQVEGMGDQIGARGSVRTLLYNMAPSEKANGPMQTQSDALTAFKTEGRVDLIGNVKIDDGDRHMTGEKASFFFSPNHQMQRIEAQNHIVLLEPALGRKATGDKAVYDVARRVIRMTGSPVTVTDPKQSLSGEQIAIDLNRNKVEVISPTAATQGTYKPQ